MPRFVNRETQLTWEYREVGVAVERTDRPVNEWLRDGWELVGLHRKHTRNNVRVVAILRRQAVERQEVAEPFGMTA
jgi:hypothetical protein